MLALATAKSSAAARKQAMSLQKHYQPCAIKQIF